MDDIRRLFGIGQAAVSAMGLRRLAMYARSGSSGVRFADHPIEQDSRHVSFLWAALGELSVKQIAMFVRALMATGDTLLLGSRTTTQICLCVTVGGMHPVVEGTQAAEQHDVMPLLSCKVGRLTFENSQNKGALMLGLQLPRYSSVKVTYQHVLAFIALPDTAP